MQKKALNDLFIIIRGAGEMATGVACMLYRANIRRILMLEKTAPLAVRRKVSFCEALYGKIIAVEGIEAVGVSGEADTILSWNAGRIAVRVDPTAESVRRYMPDVLIDATVGKINAGISLADAPFVIALGPGFVAGIDCHVVVETNRGHDLGRLITAGMATADTGIPGNVCGYTRERVLRAPTAGVFVSERCIGDRVRNGESVGRVDSAEVTVQIGGVLRGLIKSGSYVTSGLKIGDVDPRGEASYCDTTSEKARMLGGAVLEAVLTAYNR